MRQMKFDELDIVEIERRDDEVRITLSPEEPFASTEIVASGDELTVVEHSGEERLDVDEPLLHSNVFGGADIDVEWVEFEDIKSTYLTGKEFDELKNVCGKEVTDRTVRKFKKTNDPEDDFYHSGYDPEKKRLHKTVSKKFGFSPSNK